MSICIVVGNGPSLEEVDLSLIADLPAIAFNHSHVAWPSLGLCPKYYACFDPVALEDGYKEISALIESKSDMTFMLNSMALELGIKSSDRVKMYNLEDRHSLAPNGSSIAELGSVTATSIPILATMGFSKFVLLGIDARYSQARGDPIEGSDLIRLSEDNDHFFKDYGVGKRRLANPDLNSMLRGWSRLAESQDTLSIKILNASPGSALQYFEQTSLSEALMKFI